MLVGTLALLFIVPTMFIVFEYLQEKLRPALKEDMDVQTVKEHGRYLVENSMFNPNNQMEK